MTVAELIEKLREYPPDKDARYWHVVEDDGYWDSITNDEIAEGEHSVMIG